MVVDIVIVLIIALSTFLAYRKGLVNLAMGLVSFIIAIVVTAILYKPVANLIINITSIDEAIENVIYEKANDVLEDDNESKSIKKEVVDNVKNKMLPETARKISINIVSGIVMIVLFLVVNIGLRFVTALANYIAKLPILDQINKAGGIVYGLIRGLVIIYILLLIMTGVSHIYPNNKVNNDIEKSTLAKTLSDHNIFSVFFESIDTKELLTK